MHGAEEILSNVVWLIDNFDDEALEAVRDIPFLEMAKAVTIAPSSVTSTPSSRTWDKRHIPFWYSTIRKDGTRRAYDFHCVKGRLSYSNNRSGGKDHVREDWELLGVGDKNGRERVPLGVIENIDDSAVKKNKATHPAVGNSV